MGAEITELLREKVRALDEVKWLKQVVKREVQGQGKGRGEDGDSLERERKKLEEEWKMLRKQKEGIEKARANANALMKQMEELQKKLRDSIEDMAEEQNRTGMTNGEAGSGTERTGEGIGSLGKKDTNSIEKGEEESVATKIGSGRMKTQRERLEELGLGPGNMQIGGIGRGSINGIQQQGQLGRGNRGRGRGLVGRGWNQGVGNWQVENYGGWGLGTGMQGNRIGTWDLRGRADEDKWSNYKRAMEMRGTTQGARG